MNEQTPLKSATLYRMVLETHVCPYGVAAKELLEHEGFAVEDCCLRTREDVDAFKAEHGVDTTPLAFIDGKPAGGYHDLRRRFGA